MNATPAPSPLSRRSKGFSLVEVLTVVAVIGILAAVSIPILHRFLDGARIPKAMRNAQNLASLAAAASASGATLDTTSIDTLLTQLTSGQVNGSGSMSSTSVRSSALSREDVNEAKTHLVLGADGVLVYDGQFH